MLVNKPASTCNGSGVNLDLRRRATYSERSAIGRMPNVSELNRYLFKQLLGPFGFFALVFAGVLWLTQSLRLFDTLISNGQSPRTFFEFSALVLPNVMLFVIPLATFAATLYTLNKLYSESELVVMLMSGRSPWSLAGALLLFGTFAMITLLVFTLYLIPISRTQLENRLLDVRTELTNSLIVEGRFNHPVRGVTTFIRDTNDVGQMAGIFIHDARERSNAVTYSANRAVLVKDGREAQIVMFDGVMQRLTEPSEAYSTVTFERLAFDLSEFIATDENRRRRPGEYFLLEALNPTQQDLSGRWNKGDFLAVAHEKLVTPLLTLTLPLVALGSILAGSFRRGGFSLRMTMGVGLLILLQSLLVVTRSAVTDNWQMWPVSYLPVIVAVVISLFLIYLATRTKGPSKPKSVPA